MRRLDELHPPVGPVGYPPPGEGDLERAHDVHAAEQHPDMMQRHPLVPQGLDLLGDPFGFPFWIFKKEQAGVRIPLPVGPEDLGVLLPGTVDHRIGQVEDRLGAAVVFLQLDEPGLGKGLEEIEHVLEPGPAEGVDALGVVPHCHDVAVFLCQKRDDVRLEVVGILILVHHDVAVPLPKGILHAFIFQEDLEVDQEVVVVEEVVFYFITDIFLPELLQLLGPVDEVGVVLDQDLPDGDGSVERGADHRFEGAPGREAHLPAREAEPHCQTVEKLLAVRLIQKGDRALVVEALGEPSDGRVAEAVKGPTGDCLAEGVVSRGPGEHLPGGPAGEGEQKDRFRGDAPVNKGEDPVLDDAGLAGAGPGDDEDRAVHRSNRLVLGGIQFLAQECLAICHRTTVMELGDGVKQEGRGGNFPA